jgi:hypothetical protein
MVAIVTTEELSEPLEDVHFTWNIQLLCVLLRLPILAPAMFCLWGHLNGTVHLQNQCAGQALTFEVAGTIM